MSYPVHYPCLHNYDWLYNQHVILRKSAYKIATESGIKSHSSVIKALKRLKIPYDNHTYPDRCGKNNPSWRGGKRDSGKGYIYVYSPNHPHKSKQNVVLEHRLVMEKEFKRYLLPSEEVHHVNGNRQDNRPENLEVLSHKEHVQKHFHAVQEVEVLKKEVDRLKKILIENNIKLDEQETQ